jgi:hypothetical protein
MPFDVVCIVRTRRRDTLRLHVISALYIAAIGYVSPTTYLRATTPPILIFMIPSITSNTWNLLSVMTKGVVDDRDLICDVLVSGVKLSKPSSR